MTLVVRCALALMLLGVLACDSPPQGPYPESSPPQPDLLTFGPGDKITVAVYGEDDLSGEYTVGGDGSINFPLIGHVIVTGKTASQVEKDIQARLADGYLVKPQVAVRASAFHSKRVSVIGEVNEPGTFPYEPQMSIVEAIGKAGGFTPMAKKNEVRVTRKVDGKGQRIVVAVEEIGRGRAPNFYIYPGDVIFVPERIF